jgi:hypothetical protein
MWRELPRSPRLEVSESMTRTESSVSVSVQALLDAEEHRRAEQVIVANRLKQEHERRAFEESARRANEAKLRAEAALAEMRQQAQCDREQAERLDRERSAHLERTRAELELSTKAALLRLEQQNELERLALQRDVRLRRLEGQRAMLIALLVTTAIGAATIYGGVLRPGRLRLEADITRSLRLGEESRAEAERERGRLRATIAEHAQAEEALRQRIADLSQSLAAHRKPALERANPGARVPFERRPVAPSACTCSKVDPLCDCW